MNQFVAPTSFITETSRRRAKMAMRMELRIRTAAETMRTTATPRKTHFEDVDHLLLGMDLLERRGHRQHPGCPLEGGMSWLASLSTPGCTRRRSASPASVVA